MESVKDRLILHHAIDRRITLDQAAQVFEDWIGSQDLTDSLEPNADANIYSNDFYAYLLLSMRRYPLRYRYSYFFEPAPDEHKRMHFESINERFESCGALEGCTGQIKTWDLLINGDKVGRICNISMYQETHSDACPLKQIVFVKYGMEFNKQETEETNT